MWNIFSTLKHDVWAEREQHLYENLREYLALHAHTQQHFVVFNLIHSSEESLFSFGIATIRVQSNIDKFTPETH